MEIWVVKKVDERIVNWIEKFKVIVDYLNVISWVRKVGDIFFNEVGVNYKWCLVNKKEYDNSKKYLGNVFFCFVERFNIGSGYCVCVGNFFFVVLDCFFNMVV